MTDVYSQERQSLSSFIEHLQSHLSDHKQHVIIEFNAEQELNTNEIEQLETIEKQIRGNDLSFVVVALKLDYDSSDTLTVVPSVDEAHDLISFEEMQRDLLE